MKNRTLKYSTNYVILILIVLGILGILNGISSRHFIRFDLTENKQFTISDASHKVARELDDVVNVTVYFSKDLPPYMLNLRNQVRDILLEYAAFSKGRINVQWENPEKDEETEQKLMRLGIPKLQLNIIQRDKQELMTAYLGMVVSYEDRQEVLPVIKNTSNLEYDVTSALLKVIRSDPLDVGLFTGMSQSTPGMPPQDAFAELRRALGQNYEVRDISFTNGIPIPAGLDTLLVLNPQTVTERDKYEIDQFIMGGGKVIFMVDPITMGEGLSAQPAKSGLSDLLAFYGIKTGGDLVCDVRNAYAAFNSGYLRFSLPYPFWPKMMKPNFEPGNPVVDQLESLVLPWSGQTRLIDENLKGRQTTVLVRSSDRSWLVDGEGGYNLNPQQKFNPAPEDVKSYPLAVVLTGSFQSFFTGREVPEPVMADDGRPAPPPREDRTIVERSPETSICFIANSKFVEDQFLQMFPFNLTFIHNLTDWTTMGDALIGIRSRPVSERPIKEDIDDSTKTLIKILNLLGGSILVITFGVVRLFITRRKRRLA
ncbi:GldG family protein [bacterium]|nr:GldG family protein [candidate division CSSED10-310 bacterium]